MQHRDNYHIKHRHFLSGSMMTVPTNENREEMCSNSYYFYRSIVLSKSLLSVYF